MRMQFSMSGAAYGRLKDAFKQLIREHGLAWKGTREYFVWQSKSEKVVAEYDRDPAKEITLACRLNWDGPEDSKLLPALVAWARANGIEVREGAAAPAPAPPVVDLLLWETVNRPAVSRMRAEGAPTRWIERSQQTFDEERAARTGLRPPDR